MSKKENQSKEPEDNKAFKVFKINKIFTHI